MENNFMNKAFEEAEKALNEGEVPVGAVIIKDNKVIASAFNKKEKNKCSLEHAELLAIKKACRKVGNWRLDGCDIYVTLEPCPMCASAIKQSRIKNVYSAISNSNKDSSKLVFEIFSSVDNNPIVNLYNDLDEVRAESILKRFFLSKRG